jgi:CubicO group peptidase (beta-lactamase class C family)
LTLEKELSEGYILSYLFYDDGVVKYNGKAATGRLNRDVDDEMLFFTHSTGKSITSYIVGHAICEGYISSANELIDWPMMRNTLYQGQPLLDLLNMRAGDKHTIDERHSHYVMGSKLHHRNMGLNRIAALLEGTKKKGRSLFYNNFLADVIANYVVFKAGNNYDDLMRKVFQDKAKIAHPVSYEKHKKTWTVGDLAKYYGDPQTLASYSFFMTRMDFLRVAEAMMKDYQNQTCVGRYLKEAQQNAEPWGTVGDHLRDNSKLWINNYAQKYGYQFYFNFQGMSDRNIFGTEGYNGQNMLIDMDNSRIVVTNSAASAWDTRLFMLNVIKDGVLPN